MELPKSWDNPQFSPKAITMAHLQHFSSPSFQETPIEWDSFTMCIFQVTSELEKSIPTGQ